MRKLVVVLISGTICLLLGMGSVMAAKYNEAPMLKIKVAAGELPPVEERLPEEPLVIPVVEKIGEYGGTIHVQSLSPGSWETGGWQIINFECILRVAPDGKTILPNLAKDYKLSEDGKTLTLHLRKGIKWSDGAPFTADDILFWYEDVILNDELTPVKPKRWSPGGKLMKMEKIDDYTVRLHFAAPYPLVTLHLVRAARGSFYLPKHYLKQFHPRYTPMEKLEKMTREEGYNYWYQLFNVKRDDGWGGKAGVGYPTLRSHVLIEKKGEVYIAGRNPYYWKVDPAGNQLPYIDKVFITAGVGSRELMTGKVLSGQVDYDCQMTSLANLPLYKENAEKAKYRVLLWPHGYGNFVSYQPNQTYKKDLVLRDIFRDVRFRRALSLAINREEINEALYFGMGVPRQTTVVPDSIYFEEEFAKAYAEYNPEEANRLLDEMGLKWDANHQWRLRPDGKKLSITLEYIEEETPMTATSELVKEYWKAIGIDLNLKVISSELMWQRYAANNVQMGASWGSGYLDISFPLDPSFYVPMATGLGGCWGTLWAHWYLSGGKEGEEPPEEVKKNIERWERMQVTMDEKERVRLGKEILRSQAENLWVIGTVGMAPHPIIVRNNLRNVPEKVPYYTWDLYFSTIAYPEQFFFEHPLLESQKG